MAGGGPHLSAPPGELPQPQRAEAATEPRSRSLRFRERETVRPIQREYGAPDLCIDRSVILARGEGARNWPTNSELNTKDIQTGELGLQF